MAYSLPDDLSSVPDLQKELDKVLSESKTLVKVPDEKMTDEQVSELKALGAAAAAIKGAQADRVAAQDARSQEIAAAKADLNTVDADDAEPADPAAETTEGGDDPAPAEDPAAEAPIDPAADPMIVPDDASGIDPMADPLDPAPEPMLDPAPEDIPSDDPSDDEEDPAKKEKTPVTASATPTQSAAERARDNAPAVTDPAIEAERPQATIVASANLNSFVSGQELTLDNLVEAFSQKIGSLPKHRIEGISMQRNGVAQFKKGIDERFQLKRGEQTSNQSKVTAAAADYKSRLVAAGSDPKALVAAGGWCAPSETLYDIPTLEEISGILNLPEVTIDHGGVSFTKGPDFSDIYTDSGFLQTEAQAEAGVTKNFIDVECPGFQEARLDAIGFGVRAGILTNAAWPELVQRYLDGTRTAHAHKVNAYKINKIVAAGGTAVTAGSLGAAVPDSLSALEMQAVRLRYKFRMAETTPIEGFAPIWFMSVLRQDLAYQEGVDAKAITDAQVNSWLNVRHISLQWVYDYLDLAAVGTTWPTTVTIPLYPVGTYVAGTTDVLTLDAVYDTAGLMVNTYTAAFYEEGVMVFNPVANSVNVAIPLVAYGRSGAHDITNRVAA